MNRTLATLALSTTLIALAGCSKKDDGKAPSADPSATASADKPAPSASAPPKAPEVPFEERVKASKPLEQKTEEQAIPGGKVSAEICEVEGGPLLAKSNMDLFRAVRVVGSRLFAVTGTDDTIHAYTIGAGPKCTLTVDKSWNDGALKLAHVERLARDEAGNLWASTGVFGAKRFGKDGKESGKCDGKPLGYLFAHPNGKLAIGTFANSTVAKVALAADGTCKTEPWAFTDLSQAAKRKGPLSNAQAVGFVGDTIFMGGTLAKEVDPNGPNVILALDASGKEKFRMGNTARGATDDRFGWVHAIAPCKAGVCVLDSNYRRVTLWKSAGAFVASVDLSKLFDLKYPWIADFDRDKAGATYFVTGQDREGAKGVAQGTVYRVKGL